MKLICDNAYFCNKLLSDLCLLIRFYVLHVSGGTCTRCVPDTIILQQGVMSSSCIVVLVHHIISGFCSCHCLVFLVAYTPLHP